MIARRGYADGPFGQIHWRMAAPAAPTGLPDLYCLHPAPFSGLAFATILPHLSAARRVFAPDYPGHGGSDAFREDPSIGEYAAAMDAAINALSGDAPVDLMGFHTGCLVATELSVINPRRVRSLVLVDAPAFDAATRASLRASMAMPLEITPDMACLAGAWASGMTRRIESQGVARSFEMFIEQLRHGRAMNAAFHAAFTYDVEDRLPRITRPTAVIATQSPLLAPTRRAAQLIAGARLEERLDITRAVLDEAAQSTARSVCTFLDNA